MTKSVIFRFLLVLTFAVAGLFNPIIHAKKYVKAYVFSEYDIVNDALGGIQQLLNNAGDREKPYFIRKIYDISENQVSVTTKAYFVEYRKKPLYEKEVFSINNYYSLINEVGSKIEFVYKNTDKDHITQINKKIKRDKAKKIAFNAHDFKVGKQRLS